MGILAGFGGHDFIAHQQVALTWTVDMVTKEHPKQGGPRDHRREKALHRAVTAPFACPAGDAQHGDPSCHHQHGQRNPAALAQGRCRHMGLEAVEKCYNIDHRCSPFWSLRDTSTGKLTSSWNCRSHRSVRPRNDSSMSCWRVWSQAIPSWSAN